MKAVIRTAWRSTALRDPCIRSDTRAKSLQSSRSSGATRGIKSPVVQTEYADVESTDSKRNEGAGRRCGAAPPQEVRVRIGHDPGSSFTLLALVAARPRFTQPGPAAAGDWPPGQALSPF